ncbi:hypothetical protein [Citrobacter braakii]|uniref:hypothetical protein n=1 Tax=Citrobacter braakii TaxID=57706 RepID=UPI00308103B8
MKKFIIAFLVIIFLTGGTLWYFFHISGTALNCQSTFEKNTTDGFHARGVIAFHFFRDHTGVASVLGEVITESGVYILNREAGFTYEEVDRRKGVFRMKKTYFNNLYRDNIPARYASNIGMNMQFRKSDYLIIRKINKNTFLFTYPAAPVMLCVTK